MHLYFCLHPYRMYYIHHNNRLYHNLYVRLVMVVMAIELVLVLSFYTFPLLLFSGRWSTGFSRKTLKPSHLLRISSQRLYIPLIL